jgi:two-component system sensor histidine kinase KdpD
VRLFKAPGRAYAHVPSLRLSEDHVIRPLIAVRVSHVTMAILIIVACTVLNWLLIRWLTPTDAAMVYLLGVMLTAVYYERPASIVAALLSFLAFDIFFVPPTLTLRFGSTQYLITALVLLTVGLVTSALAARVRREAQSAARAEVAANDERIRSSLLASISHDLRTPLAVIAGSASSLRENRERMSVEQQNQLLETIYQRSLSMSTEVSDLLEMTRLHTGRVTLDRQWYPLEELVGAALERCRTLIGTRAVTVELPQEICLVNVDGVLIEKLFVNLIENAALHTPADTPIEIAGTRKPDTLVVAVRDRGPGLPPGAEELIFEKFERGARSGMSSGSGLGLSICRAIADLHGAAVTARNRPDGGAEFTVRFPCEPAPQMPAST